MTPLVIEATYENGVLKPAGPLPFEEKARVRITIDASQKASSVSDGDAETVVHRSHGLLGWTGDVETLRRIAEDPDFSILECR